MKLFNSNTERELWIKLNAEKQIEWEKSLALCPKTVEIALKTARNQCEYDENEGKLRFSLENLLSLNCVELNKIVKKYNVEWHENAKKN